MLTSLPAVFPPSKHRNERRSTHFMVLLVLCVLCVSLIPPSQPTKYVAPASGTHDQLAQVPPAVSSPAASVAPPAASVAYPLPAELIGKPEIAAARTMSSATFDMGDGRYGQMQSSEPLHYHDANGAWQPIDPAFAALQDGWANTTNTLQTSVAQTRSAAKIVHGTVGTGWEPSALVASDHSGWSLDLATPRTATASAPGVRSADGMIVRYLKNWTDAHVRDQWQSGFGQSEYTLSLESLPSVSSHMPQNLDLRVQLHLRPGTHIEVGNAAVSLPLETSAPISFVGTEGEPIVLLPPVAYEQQDLYQRIPGSYMLAATTDPSVVELRVRFPWRWFAASERHFPVVLDPLFQVKSPAIARTAVYKTDGNTTSFARYDDSRPLTLGNIGDGGRLFGAYGTVRRLLVSFNLSQMPEGTDVERAVLSLTATGATSTVMDRYRYDFKLGNTEAFQMPDRKWYSDNTAPPSDTSLATLNPTSANSSYIWRTDSESLASANWDVTALAKEWIKKPSLFKRDPSVMVRANPQDEFCIAESYKCGGFMFDLPSTWDDSDLVWTERYSKPDSIATGGILHKRGGIRLLVFYNGPTLAENTPIISDPPIVGQNIFQTKDGLRDPTNVFATHEYRIPPLPSDRLQAVAVRGFGPFIGPVIPTNPSEYRLDPLTGELPIQLRKGDDSAVANDSLPIKGSDFSSTEPLIPPGNVNYVLLNGRQHPGTAYRLRVQKPEGTILPESYEVRLIREEQESLVTDLPGDLPPEGRKADSTELGFSTAEPMRLWNIQVPTNSNNRVRIDIKPVGSPPFTKGILGFGASLFPGDLNTLQQQPLDPALNPSGYGNLSSSIFTATSSNYALALSYSGPKATYFSFGIHKLQAVYSQDFYVTVHVVSCSANVGGFPTFPTEDGTCQPVKCPAAGVDGAIYRSDNGLAIWNEGGWTNNVTNPISSAPMIGQASGSSAPTVAVIGGQVAINGPGSWTIGTPGTTRPNVMLVQCGPPGDIPTPPLDFFDAFYGKMQRVTGGIFLSPLGESNNPHFDPWFNTADDADIDQQLVIDPSNGTAGGKGRLRRVANEPGHSSSHEFDVTWSLNVGGWPLLQTTATRVSGGTATVASLHLTMNGGFSLDAVAANGKDAKRQIVAVRAAQATIAQDITLGGASKPVQALILVRKSAAVSPIFSLRALDDTPDRPNLTWSMPDIHLQDQAQTVAFGTAGAMQVYSTDHPQSLAATNESVQFSYDTFGAKVSITQETCDGPDIVSVIRGETQIELPNVGDGTLPNQGIVASFKLCETSLRNVKMSFSSPVGIPIGNSSLFMTGLRGEVTIAPNREHTRIDLGIDFQAAPDGDGGILKATGTVTIDTRGLFAFKGTGSLLKGTVGISGSLWIGWSPLDIGFNEQISYPLKKPWLTGGTRAHMWRGQGWQGRYPWLPNNDDTHIAAQMTAKLEIKEGAIFDWWFIKIPPGDSSIDIDLAFGQFCTNNACTSYEWGVKGRANILGYDIGVYYGFDHGFDFILGNDDHMLIDQYGGTTDSPVLAQYRLAQSKQDVQVQAAPQAVAGTALVPITISPNAESVLFGLGWQAGAPQFSLIGPDGVEITAANAAQHHATVTVTATNSLIAVRDPIAGQWQAKIANLSADRIEHYKFVYFANKGAPVKQGDNTFIKPAQVNEEATNSYQITWQVPIGTPDTTTVSLYYSNTQPITGNLDVGAPIVQHLPFRDGQYLWDTTALASGVYQIYAVVDDGINDLPVSRNGDPNDSCAVPSGELPAARAFDPNRFPGTNTFTATGTVRISDTTPPAIPEGLTLAAADGALLAHWTLGQEKDLVAYQVSWGAVLIHPRQVDQFQSTPLQQRVTATKSPTLRIGGLTNDALYGVQIAAIDASGNVGPVSPILVAQPNGAALPIPLAPTTFTVTAVLSTSANFTWMSAAGTPSASYRLMYRQIGATTPVQQVTTTETSATLANLQPGATYDVTISAGSNEGWRSAETEPIRFVATNGSDTDGDGLPDDWSAAYAVHGSDSDPDADGLSNIQEWKLGTNPTLQNSDGDVLSDFEEAQGASDPLDSTSYSAAILQPRLSLEQDQVEFRLKLQTNDPVPTQSIIWSNVGGGNLYIQAVSSLPWLKTAIDGNEVKLSVDPARLEPGFYSGVVRLLPTLGSDVLIGTPQCIRVTTWASPPDSGFVYRRSLPIIAKEAPTLQATGPNLIGSIAITPNKRSFNAGESVQMTASITNTGGTASGSFWVDAYINPSAPPTTPNVRWNEVCELNPCHGLAWYVAGLAPGESITLTSTAASYAAGQTIWPGWFASGTTDLYLYIDSWNPGVPYGAVQESDETDNSFRIQGLQVTGVNPQLATTQNAADLPRRPLHLQP